MSSVSGGSIAKSATGVHRVTEALSVAPPSHPLDLQLKAMSGRKVLETFGCRPQTLVAGPHGNVLCKQAKKQNILCGSAQKREQNEQKQRRKNKQN